MKPLWRDTLVVAACFAGGGAAAFLFGASPATLTPERPVEQEWRAVGMLAPDLVADAGIWEARTPWGAPPKAPEPPPPPPAPPPVPVGIVKVGRGHDAIFMIQGTGSVRLPVGGALPDGGRLLAVSGMRVTWVDGQGQQHERRMFIDPAQLPSAEQVP